MSPFLDVRSAFFLASDVAPEDVVGLGDIGMLPVAALAAVKAVEALASGLSVGVGDFRKSGDEVFILGIGNGSLSGLDTAWPAKVFGRPFGAFAASPTRASREMPFMRRPSYMPLAVLGRSVGVSLTMAVAGSSKIFATGNAIGGVMDIDRFRSRVVPVATPLSTLAAGFDFEKVIDFLPLVKARLTLLALSSAPCFSSRSISPSIVEPFIA